jgi:hypothetical protein
MLSQPGPHIEEKGWIRQRMAPCTSGLAACARAVLEVAALNKASRMFVMFFTA